MMNSKPKFSLGSKILYAVLVVLILLMFWPGTRAVLQRGFMEIGLFKPSSEQAIKMDESANVSEAHVIRDKALFLDADGRTVSTEDLKGKVVFINFWATWCGPCVAEMPSIQKLYDQFAELDEVEFILVEIEGDMDMAKGFLQEHDLHMPVYIPAGDIPGDWLAGAIPSTIVLDKNGRRVFKHEGMADYSDQGFVDFIKKTVDE